MSKTIFAAFFILMFFTGSAWAGQCSNPVRDEGVIIYNTDHHLMQYCNGTQWMAMGTTTGMVLPGSGCSPSCNMYSGLGYIPATSDTGDTTDAELGISFTVTVPGKIAAIQFYKFAGNTGTHTAHLWSAGGTLLATKAFSGETATGWQTATLTTPVSVAPGQKYIASYWETNGYYATDNFSDVLSMYLVSAVALPVHSGMGLYTYGTNGSFPATASSFHYGVDVVFVPD